MSARRKPEKASCPERFQGLVDHGLVGLADPFLGKAVDGSAFREVEPELAVHVLDGPLLVGDVGVGEEHPGPDLPVPTGLDRGEVGEAGVVVDSVNINLINFTLALSSSQRYH